MDKSQPKTWTTNSNSLIKETKYLAMWDPRLINRVTISCLSSPYLTRSMSHLQMPTKWVAALPLKSNLTWNQVWWLPMKGLKTTLPTMDWWASSNRVKSRAKSSHLWIELARLSPSRTSASEGHNLSVWTPECILQERQLLKMVAPMLFPSQKTAKSPTIIS